MTNQELVPEYKFDQTVSWVGLATPLTRLTARGQFRAGPGAPVDRVNW